CDDDDDGDIPIPTIVNDDEDSTEFEFETAIYYGDSNVNITEPFSITCIIPITDPINWLKDGKTIIHHNLRHGRDEHSYMLSESAIEGEKHKIEAHISVRHALKVHEGKYQCNNLHSSYHLLHVRSDNENQLSTESGYVTIHDLTPSSADEIFTHTLAESLPAAPAISLPTQNIPVPIIKSVPTTPATSTVSTMQHRQHHHHHHHPKDIMKEHERHKFIYINATNFDGNPRGSLISSNKASSVSSSRDSQENIGIINFEYMSPTLKKSNDINNNNKNNNYNNNELTTVPWQYSNTNNMYSGGGGTSMSTRPSTQPSPPYIPPPRTPYLAGTTLAPAVQQYYTPHYQTTDKQQRHHHYPITANTAVTVQDYELHHHHQQQQQKQQHHQLQQQHQQKTQIPQFPLQTIPSTFQHLQPTPMQTTYQTIMYPTQTQTQTRTTMINPFQQYNQQMQHVPSDGSTATTTLLTSAAYPAVTLTAATSTPVSTPTYQVFSTPMHPLHPMQPMQPIHHPNMPIKNGEPYYYIKIYQVTQRINQRIISLQLHPTPCHHATKLPLPPQPLNQNQISHIIAIDHGLKFEIEPDFLVPNYDNAEQQLKVFEIRSSLVLSCNVTKDGIDEVTWEKNGTDVSKVKELTGRYRIIKQEKTFIIDKTDTYDDGVYSCVANNQRKDINVVALVVVRVPSNTGVVEGEKLTIACTVVGSNPKLSWDIGNETIITSSKDRYILKPDDNKVQNALLTIENVSLDDRGEYKCIGHNDATLYANYKEASDASYVRVKGKLAAVWPFLGIVAEVLILCTIILIYEKRRNKSELEESDTDPQEQ
ncbi:uncharacterized protein LOC119688224, partial [Teleopsis dalmanni]|uniref:uncharacterized protein LOC119688224 n=1 Tax=Teleopsis dalmanni TaxID=139649 RepID=UPI0018CCB137